MFIQEINLRENKEFNTFSIFVEIEQEYLIVTSDNKESLNNFITKIDKINSYEDKQSNEFYSIDTELIKNIEIEDITEEVKLFESYFKKSVTQKSSDNFKEFEILLNSLDGINTLIEHRTREVVIWVNKNEYFQFMNEENEETAKLNNLQFEVVGNSVIEFVG